MPNIYMPNITEVTITPNPCLESETIIIKIAVSDMEVVPQTVYTYSGMHYSGEVIAL
jgi:hypothetical protein